MLLLVCVIPRQSSSGTSHIGTSAAHHAGNLDVGAKTWVKLHRAGQAEGGNSRKQPVVRSG